MPLNIAILASGTGSNAQAIIDKVRAGILDVEISLVFSNRPGAAVLERAAAAGIPNKALDHTLYGDRRAYEKDVLDILRECGCQLAVLAGYMRLLSKYFLDGFAGSIINLHPAILPSFPGTHGAESALEYGVKITGASVHFVEEQMDSGPLIIQAAVPVMAGEDAKSLQSRIHAVEHRIYPQAIQWLAQDRITLRGRQVLLSGAGEKTEAMPENTLIWPPLEKGF